MSGLVESINNMWQYIRQPNRGVSTETDPIAHPTTLGSSCTSRGIEDETTKNCTKMLGRFHLPVRPYCFLACLDQDTDLTMGRDYFLQDKMGNYQDKL